MSAPRPGDYERAHTRDRARVEQSSARATFARAGSTPDVVAAALRGGSTSRSARICVSDYKCGLGGSRKHPRPQLWLRDLPTLCRTGDVVLFSSKHAASNITKFFTASEWDHVGIVVRPSPQRCFLLEWGGGLFVCDLVERLEEYSDEDGRTIAWRSLKVPRAHREQIEDRMEAFVHRLLNDPARHDNQAMPLKSVLPAVRHQLNVLGRGVRHARHEVIEDLSALFCSKTVAVCYKAAGLLHKTRHASDFLPKHWSADFDYMLQLRGSAVLAPEVVLTFESELQRGLLLRFLALADLGRVDRDRSARVLQRAARRLLALREADRLRSEQSVVQRAATFCRVQFGGAAEAGAAKKLSERHEIHRLLCGELNELARAHHEHHNPLAQEHAWKLEALQSAQDDEEVHV